MSLSLADVLAHPSFAAGRPVVRAGADLLTQPVRWVHSSEVIDIAHLLRGGELLLTGGFALASADPAGLRRYVRELSARRVAGVAVETGPQLPQIPAELVEEATEVGLPVVELRGVVPFVEVAEAINGLLVNESVQRLRRGDAVAHALSEELARGGGPDELLEVLARLLPGDVTLLDATGDVIAALGDEMTAPAAGSGVFAVPVFVQGVGVATLLVSPDDPADHVTAEAIVERAPTALAISLLRSFPPSAAVRAAQALLRIVCQPNPAPERLVAAARAAGMVDGASYVGVVGRAVDGPVSLAAIDAALHRYAAGTVSSVAGDELHAIVVLRSDDRVGSCAALVESLRATARAELARVAVGPVVIGLLGLPGTLAEARFALDLAADLGIAGTVVDAAELALERLGRRIGDPALLTSFVLELLGPLLAVGPERARRLIDTLDVYLQCGCSKTEAAARLHVQRQTLYQRLDQIFALLGEDPTGSPRLAAVHLATRLYLGGVVDTTAL
ncbi:CdaR family transcriptional regulator [Rhodococcus wratislaviensis]|uniref:CdaR family transcriptional regulator n=1 Tax=Rhodococcus wratislaviensis TaxID=44752 RepID=A0AB38FM92_RHOWR|nr:PucR family transcriptional regulator [Rhodococcus wratislaviensis]REE76401.1 CdaR family transcriptional regulator [Rhodococcus wratislaviensis]SPZ42522.1 CdaR family transcriptional regulator [Rhodococcus wratislaviensis]